MSLFHRTCPCGKEFITCRTNVRWHSNECRKLTALKNFIKGNTKTVTVEKAVKKRYRNY